MRSPSSAAATSFTHGGSRTEKEWEFFVHAFDDQGPQLAEQLAATARTWDRNVRDGAKPVLTVHSAGTPDRWLPAGDVLDKPLSRLVFQWPGRNTLLPAPVERCGWRL